MQADPIGVTGGTNLYAYVGGDAVNAVDLKGLSSIGLTGEFDLDLRGLFDRDFHQLGQSFMGPYPNDGPEEMRPDWEDGCPFSIHCSDYELQMWSQTIWGVLFWTESLGLSDVEALYQSGWYARVGCEPNGESAGYEPYGNRGQMMRAPDGSLHLTPAWHAEAVWQRKQMEEGVAISSGYRNYRAQY